MPSNQPGMQQPLPPGKKGSGVWFWVIGGCLGIVLLGGLAILGLGYFGVKKFQETTGLSSEEFQNRPAFAAAKLLTALNPDIELVDADERTERITIREKNTGKTVSITLDELKQGRIRFTDDSGEEFEMRVQEDGESGSLQIQGRDGRQVLNIGSSASANLPAWVPTPEGSYSNRQQISTEGNATYTGRLTTPLSADEFTAWFEKAATDSGLQMKSRTVSTSNNAVNIFLHAEGNGGKRTLSAMGNQNSDGGCTILYSAIEKE